MKYALSLFLSAALVTHLTSASAEPAPISSLGALPASTVVVAVDDATITMADLNQELNRPDLKAATEALKDQPAELERLRKSVLSSIIDKQLLMKAAKKSPNYRPDDVKKEVDTIIQEQGGQAVISPILTGYGTSWDVFVRDMNDRLTIEKFIEKDLLQNITVSDDELKAAFNADPSMYGEPETVSARHILILANNQAPDAEQKAALKRIQEIRAKVTAPGADFGKIASETSDDTASRVDGGNLGSFQRGMMVPEFEKAAFSLKVGEISEPIKTEYGYHIIKVEQHKPAESPTFENAKDKVRDQVMAKTQDKVISEKITQLRSTSKIEYKVPELKQS